MRIGATSDTHGFLPEVPDCDILIHAGDITRYGLDRQGEVDYWTGEFYPWLLSLAERGIHVVGIAGNHDFILQEQREFARTLPWHYLEDTAKTIYGLKFYGSPWQPYFGGWAFNAPQFDTGEGWLDSRFREIPDDTDILVTHTPPRGILDRVGGKHVGSSSLNRHVQRVMPKLHVFGHIHHAFGVENIEGVTCANVSAVKVINGGKDYAPANPVVLFDL